jgi:hypothetical protein
MSPDLLNVLKPAIRESFADVPKPAQLDIVSHRCCECDELAADLFPHDACDLPEAVFARHVWDLPLLSDDGKRYYLAAWLLRALEPDDPGAADAVIYALDSDHRWAPSTPYTSQQWLVVDQWLAAIAAGEESLRDDVERVRGKLPK